MSYVAESFAWCMLQVTIFTAFVAAAYGILRRIRPGTSSALLAFSLAVVGLLTLASVSPWPRWRAATWDRPSPHTARDAATPATIAREKAAEPLIKPTSPARELPAVLLHESEVPEFPVGPPADEAVARRASRAWLVLVVAAWIAAAVGLVRTLFAFIHVHRIRRESTPIVDGTAMQLSHALCQQLGIRRTVKLRESSRLGGAATIGWLRPIVLLPTTWREWSHEELRAAMAHELAHIRRRHFLTWLVSQAALVAHFYHPLVHWLSRRLRLEHEIEADQLASEMFGDRRRYAAVLARLALGPQPAKTAYASVGLFMSRPLLMRRISMLRQSSDPPQGSSRVARFAAFFALAASAVGVAGLRGEQPANAEAGATVAPAPPAATALASAPESGEAAAVESPVPAEATERTAAGAGRYVTALVQVSREAVGAMDGRNRPESNATWEIFCKTQLVLMKSYSVLNAAVRSPQISVLPMLQGVPNPEAMLQQRLEVGFYPNSEIMFVQMAIKPSEAEPARKIVDAVVETYIDKVVEAERQHQLKFRDQLARSLSNVGDELKRKMDAYYAIAKDLQSAEDGGSGRILQELDVRRLDRVETELMRLEDEIMKLRGSGRADKALVASYEERIEQLQSRGDELEKRLRARSEKSVDLSARKMELDQLQKIMGDMTMKLELMDAGADAASGVMVRVVQPAMVTGATQPPENGRR